MSKNIFRHRQYTLKIKSEWSFNLNIKCKIIKLLEDSVGENVGDL